MLYLRRVTGPCRNSPSLALLGMAELCGACPAGRGRRVADAAVLIGEQISMGRRRLIALGEAARLLDLGMAGLPPEVVRRSRALTAEEEDDFRLHPLRSLEIAREADVPYEALNGIIHHHERMDGLGYPMGLAGGEIPEFARILAIADTFGRLTRPWPPQQALSAADALAELQSASGSCFDPLFVVALADAINRQPFAPAHG
jgi:HD-GYP domain-containing protein (c-di-GMP phosphodiesterase class II)